jgi:hypothetical protein
MNYCTRNGNCTASPNEEKDCQHYKPDDDKCDWRSWINPHICQCEAAKEEAVKEISEQQSEK